MPTPCRAPQTDAVQRARDVEEILREAEHSAIRNIDRADLRELHELLVQPHMRVSTLQFSFQLGFNVNIMND